MKKKLLEELYKIITDEKVEKFERIAAQRTRYLTIVVENLYQDHNASAVMRSCDCFGIQDLHVIEKGNKFNVNREIAMGAGKWVDSFQYADKLYPTKKCINKLKEKGYKIVATTPHTNDIEIQDLDLSKPVALLFGTEQSGLSETALDMADEFVKIPMYGFTESFNISVSAALCIMTLRQKLEEMESSSWLLSSKEQIELKINWCKNIIKNPDAVEKDLIRRINEDQLK
jgi:tRNA (guanosine-2'-O-)-methyltransferase